MNLMRASLEYLRAAHAGIRLSNGRAAHADTAFMGSPLQMSGGAQRRLESRALAAQVGQAQQRLQQIVVGGQLDHIAAAARQAVDQRFFLLLRDGGITLAETRGRRRR